MVKSMSLRSPALWFPLLALVAGCPGEEPLELADVTVEANPVCDLSCVVRWTTDLPASSWVEFGAGDERTHRIGDDEPVTDHEVIVVGMHAEGSYGLTAVSADGDGAVGRAGGLAFDTGSLHALVSQAELVVSDPERAEPGWTLTNAATGTLSEVMIAILDDGGEVVWTYLHPEGPGRGDVAAYWLDEGHVLLGPGVPPGETPKAIALDGTVVWEGPPQPDAGHPLDPEALIDSFHHEFRRTDEGLHLTFQAHEEGDVPGDLILLLDDDGEAAWTWNAFDWLTPPEPGDLEILSGWTHFNSAVVEPDAVYVNSFGLSSVLKLDRADGHVVWTFGDGGDFARDPDAPWPWPEKGHSLERLASGNFLLYDNGGDRPFSRVVEVALDEAAMTSEVVWEYPGALADDPWGAYAWGDVDELPGGTLLVTQGLTMPDQGPHRVRELTRAGEVVWELRWGHDEDPPVWSFAAERIPALAEPL